MAYSTGTATSISNLKATIAAFCTANGWTADGDVLYKGNVYVKLAVNGTDIDIQGGKGQSAGTLTDPSLSVAKFCEVGHETVTWPATYHLFTHINPDCVVCVLNFNVNHIQWLTFGEVEKYGTWNGGQYFGAQFNHNPSRGSSYPLKVGNTTAYRFNASYGWYYPDTIALWHATKWNYDGTNRYGSMQMVCDIDGGDWIDNRLQSATSFNGSFINREIVGYGPNTWNEQAILAPVWVSVNRADDKRSIIGTVPAVRHVNIANHEIGDIMTIGSDKWMLFPHFLKDVTTPMPPGATDVTVTGDSGVLGFAVKYDGP